MLKVLSIFVSNCLALRIDLSEKMHESTHPIVEAKFLPYTNYLETQFYGSMTFGTTYQAIRTAFSTG